MGLGKTVQTIAFIGWLKLIRKVSGPYLVVAPLSVFPNWLREFRRFAPELRVLKLHSSNQAENTRLGKMDIVGNYDVVVTTYDMMKSKSVRRPLVQSTHWRYIILDEGHIIRNEDTNIAHTMRAMHFQQVILLTGTPLQNNLHELWSLLNFLEPDIFASSERFDSCFQVSGANMRFDRSLLLKVHTLLKPFMLRRTKLEVEKTVPPKVETKIMCPLSNIQAMWYKQLLLNENSLLQTSASDSAKELSSSNSSSLVGGVSSNGSNAQQWRRLKMLFMQLRKVSIHPFLFDEADLDIEVTDDSIISASGKMEVLDLLLKKLHAARHRVVLFSQFTSMLDILEDYMNYRGYEHCRIDGQTNRVMRQVYINSFNAPDSKLFVFLMSTRSGGLGINLQTADTVILFDSDWNPQVL
jgi:SWI/SNF-related matrix-associated actin-dependent regulator of chromatin subfamily A member 5